MRLNRYIALCGICSRRAADLLITAGKVKVNGKTGKLGDTVTNSDSVEVNDGKWQKISTPTETIVYALNKPAGYISSAADPTSKKVVTTLVPPTPRVFPVGRLDADSEGLLLLTNDGDLAYSLTHPKTHVMKEYEVIGECARTIEKYQLEHKLDRVREGILLPEGRTQEAQIKILSFSPGRVVLHIGISEGKRRQIRRTLQKVGITVIRLIRHKIGGLSLDELHIMPGKYCILTKTQIEVLKNGV
ncbi:hypothetical protein A3D80_03975 [Candidatus Roizmanbacteria bacterium RIFCSPHIGHO2_02_FULL_40_13b]|nr:MAG: hypothetical protein A3D80_03975 [Candidatus Roizmanbacteria bacterium RIFCSPHIGHO2_02_FULL_40_13b]OGK56366.1 MAG: hypothetical protein A3H83_02560 [Candidatus Roizmanbacteria bacterium RIFCSPLOWO2_02_FULL_39_8]